ncbi:MULTISPECIES: GNAT family N-acetyltransferase [Niallia]|uniref:GNAT family N-acetyltransferase n=1 Tax=Niallia circulans TaxID=1397 RepID=A0AA91Z2Q7_NIACI|nr:GNAT family N-acetyltransferase [Niallia circulans]NRG26548.1 GNAT family N-acetyltransferase [Niallia circulans]PAD84770.1 GNAT family N-acetyltransferase [Niallia circulans]QJX62459.1 GNAT family N-acetyltransferase [Niallia circulans]
MINLKNGLGIQIRPYKEDDFQSIHELNKREQWTNLVEKKEDTKSAWNHSNAAYVATLNDQLIGYIRGITDRSITLFICELLIAPDYRGIGLGEKLLYYVHSKYPSTRVEMLASSTSNTYYESKGFRSFYGFRKTFLEYN